MRRILDHIKDVIGKLTGQVKTDELERLRTSFERAIVKASKQQGAQEQSGAQYKYRDVDITPETIERNMHTVVSEMSPIQTTGRMFKMGTGTLKTDITSCFASKGYVSSKVFGEVQLHKRGIKSSIGHGMIPLKALLYEVVPSVIEQGEMADYQEDYKGNPYDTAVLAAPVIVTEGPLAGEYYAGTVKIKMDIAVIIRMKEFRP